MRSYLGELDEINRGMQAAFVNLFGTNNNLVYLRHLILGTYPEPGTQEELNLKAICGCTDLYLHAGYADGLADSVIEILKQKSPDQRSAMFAELREEMSKNLEATPFKVQRMAEFPAPNIIIPSIDGKIMGEMRVVIDVCANVRDDAIDKLVSLHKRKMEYYVDKEQLASQIQGVIFDIEKHIDAKKLSMTAVIQAAMDDADEDQQAEYKEQIARMYNAAGGDVFYSCDDLKALYQKDITRVQVLRENLNEKERAYGHAEAGSLFAKEHKEISDLEARMNRTLFYLDLVEQHVENEKKFKTGELRELLAKFKNNELHKENKSEIKFHLSLAQYQFDDKSLMGRLKRLFNGIENLLKKKTPISKLDKQIHQEEKKLAKKVNVLAKNSMFRGEAKKGKARTAVLGSKKPRMT